MRLGSGELHVKIRVEGRGNRGRMVIFERPLLWKSRDWQDGHWNWSDFALGHLRVRSHVDWAGKNLRKVQFSGLWGFGAFEFELGITTSMYEVNRQVDN